MALHAIGSFLMPEMFSPPRPGETLREDVLPALDLSVTTAAAQLGIARVTLSRVLHGHAAISPELALRIEAWLGVERGGSARVWLAQQAAFDLWEASQRMKATLACVQPAPATLNLSGTVAPSRNGFPG